MTSYTSGFILTSDQVKQLASDLSLSFQAHERAAFAALAVRNHLERVDPFLERFGVCAVELWEQPALERSGEPPVRWMIPTARYNDDRAVDPGVHGNTVKIKAAVVATGVPEGYLSVFGTFPNEEYRHASVKID